MIMSAVIRKISAYLLPLALAAVSFVSCGGDVKVIPKDEMAEIYAEMLLMDQWIAAHPQARRTADTSFVYEPIFEKYGYTSDDYRSSVDYYLQDPDRYARILKNTSLILEARLGELRREKEILNDINTLAERRLLYSVEYDFGEPHDYQYDIADSVEFYTDTSGCVLKVRQAVPSDTVLAGPAVYLVSDSLGLDSGAAVLEPASPFSPVQEKAGLETVAPAKQLLEHKTLTIE